MPNMWGTGNQMMPQGNVGGQMTPDMLLMFLQMLRSLPTQEIQPEPDPRQPYDSVPLGPGELEAILGQIQPPTPQRRPIQVNPLMLRDLVNRKDWGWGQLEPGR